MSPVPMNRPSAPVGVLLGGTGRACLHTQRPAPLPALLRPWPSMDPRTADARVLDLQVHAQHPDPVKPGREFASWRSLVAPLRQWPAPALTT